MKIADDLRILCLFLFCHREEFDEEKEPEGMVLSGWTQSPATNGESASTSNNDNAVDVTESSSSGSEVASKKRRLSETQLDNHKKETEDVDSGDDDIMEIENPMMVSKKKKRVE